QLLLYFFRKMKKILCSWVGNSDWLPSEGLGGPGEPGPVARTMEDPVFGQVDELRCLNNYQHRKGSDFKKWIATKTSAEVYCEDVLLKSPTDFRGVYEATDNLIKTIRSENSEEHELIFLCSPGTWIMQNSLLMLALTKYPARLIEASEKGGVVEVDVPFEINVDYLIDRVDRARREVSPGLQVDKPELNDIIHDCRPMRLAIERVRRIAPRNISILIEGQSGTGKKLIGRLLHTLSQRSMRPLETFNCGAIP
ncbi:uncharacterized protein METZ01_LOCUS458882, partial [marine metagenome]